MPMIFGIFLYRPWTILAIFHAAVADNEALEHKGHARTSELVLVTNDSASKTQLLKRVRWSGRLFLFGSRDRRRRI